MTTNAAMPLPMITPPLRTPPSEDAGRSRHAHQQQAVRSDTADRPSKACASEPNNDGGDTDVSSTPQDAATDRKSSFADALKKRLKTDDSGTDKSDKDTDDAETSGVIEAAVAFHAPAAAPVAIKTLAGQPEKTPSKPAFHASAATGAYSQLTRKPAVHTDETLTGKAGRKLDDAVGKNASERQPANDKAAPEKAASPSQQSTERLPPSEQAAAGHLKTSSTSAVETAKPVDTLTAKPAVEGPQPEKSRDLAPIARIGNTDVSSTASKSEAETSLKNSLAGTSTLKSEQSADPESQAEGINIPHVMNVKESSSAAAEGIKTATALDLTPASATSTAASATSTAPSSTTASHGESARGINDIAAARPIDQIVQTLQLRTFGAEPHVRMMLAPEELGAIRITFRQVDSEVVGLLEVQKNETRKEIERSVTQLTAAMETAGVHVRRIEVVGWNTQTGQNPRGEQFSQDFDARSHQEMYRPSDNNSTQSPSKKGVTGNPEGHEFEADRFKQYNAGRSDAGLNFYV